MDELPEVTVDRSHTIRSVAEYEAEYSVPSLESDMTIELDMQCSADLAHDGRLVSLRDVGLKLQFSGRFPLDDFEGDPL